MFLGLLFKVTSLLSLIAGSGLVGVTIMTVSESGLPETNVTVKELPITNESLTTGDSSSEFVMTRIAGNNQTHRVARSIVIALELPSELDKANITQQLKDAKRILENLEPVLKFSAAMALAVGIVQILLAATFILSTFHKESCHYSKYWNSLYFILGSLLLICFISLWSVHESGSDVEKDLKKFREILASFSKFSKQGFTADYVKNKYMFYLSTTMDATLLYIFGFITCCCLVKL